MKGMMMSIFAIVMGLCIFSTMLPVVNCRPSNHAVEKRSISRTRIGWLMIAQCAPPIRMMCRQFISKCRSSPLHGRKRRSLSNEEENQGLSRVKRGARRRGRRLRRIHANCNTCRNCW